MKRCFVNSPQLNGTMEYSKVNNKYRSLLEDYLELQKEYVSKKKKLQVEKQKREILLDEVWFLRRRHKHLTRSQFSMVESEPGPHQKADIDQKADMGDVPLSKQRKNYKVNQSKGKGREELGSVEKKPTNFIITEKKKSGKRKISWQDKEDLNV